MLCARRQPPAAMSVPPDLCAERPLKGGAYRIGWGAQRAGEFIGGRLRRLRQPCQYQGVKPLRHTEPTLIPSANRGEM
jgi:hypothetical protein